MCVINALIINSHILCLRSMVEDYGLRVCVHYCSSCRKYGTNRNGDWLGKESTRYKTVRCNSQTIPIIYYLRYLRYGLAYVNRSQTIVTGKHIPPVPTYPRDTFGLMYESAKHKVCNLKNYRNSKK